MERILLDWQTGYTETETGTAEEWVPARVPGSVQRDWADAHGWPEYWKGVNFRDYKWMEDVFWHYRAKLSFALEKDERAYLVFEGIDYGYRITVGDEVLADGEGMFAPVRLDVTGFAGREEELRVLIRPAPKADDSDSRDQARRSAKSVACYGWDWHPRLISAGLWGDAYLEKGEGIRLLGAEVSVTLSDGLDSASVRIEPSLTGGTGLSAVLVAPDGTPAAGGTCSASAGGLTLTVDHPLLWNPQGFGEQPLYRLKLTLKDGDRTADTFERRLGFRRSRLVMNEGSWWGPADFPKSRSDAPACFEFNGRRIFAKGSNWVNAQIFPGDMTREHYRELLTLVKDAGMNILRIWGGGFVNKESFFDLCDEMGIMVWQEFPLACTEYPDDPHYLAVLEKEALAIVRRLRTHPCIALWCGGNELFNNWSRMTDQHHALRLLNAVCYREDPQTPFIMTSPLNGMAHGNYVNYDEDTGEEFITTLSRSTNTAYTEFGCPGMSPKEYQLSFMTGDDLADLSPSNEVWREHHAFGAWRRESWVRIPETEYYFGGYEGTEDLIAKTTFIQCMCYKSMFEEMRRQQPHCAMALNWCLNEPWPTAANNSLISWPAKPKEAYYAVRESLRPTLASMKVLRHRFLNHEGFSGGVWLLNDSLEEYRDLSVKVYKDTGNGEELLGVFSIPLLKPQQNAELGAVSFRFPEGFEGRFRLILRVNGHPEMDSVYTYLCRRVVLDAEGPRILNL